MRTVGFIMLLGAALFGIAAIWTGTSHGDTMWTGRLGGTGGVLFLVGGVVSRIGARKSA